MRFNPRLVLLLSRLWRSMIFHVAVADPERLSRPQTPSFSPVFRKWAWSGRQISIYSPSFGLGHTSGTHVYAGSKNNDEGDRAWTLPTSCLRCRSLMRCSLYRYGVTTDRGNHVHYRTFATMSQLSVLLQIIRDENLAVAVLQVEVPQALESVVPIRNIR